jgi:hypothetical protein
MSSNAGNNIAFQTGVFPCFDLSGFKSMSPIQFRIYKDAWNTFSRVQEYNSNISTLRSGGNTILNYYQYVNQYERTQFRQGQMLHTQVYPLSNWIAVPPN